MYTLLPIFLGIIQINQKAICAKMFAPELFVIHYSFNIQSLTGKHVVGKHGARNIKVNEIQCRLIGLRLLVGDGD